MKFDHAWIQIVLLLGLGKKEHYTSAFQNELVNQILPLYETPPDQIFFVAAQLLDQPSISLSVFTPPQLPPSPLGPHSWFTAFLYDDVQPKRPITRTISLTKEERDLFQLLRDVRDRYSPGTTLRIAGGWVRDKLLQKASKDIDCVLSDQSGSDFAKLAHDYLVQQTDQQVYCAIRSDALLKNYGKRSKHLQTASLRVGDFWVDFCHLRFEKYSQDSRIPESTGIASPVEDAWRRDLTINSLFYNVNTNQVEDWTEQGLHDLMRGVIATPMAPLTTLLEDPLRILRAIRFAAQLSFTMDPALQKVAGDHRVRRALSKKVSKDRIGSEVDTIFSTSDPARAVELLIEAKLVDVVFPLDNKQESVYTEGFDSLSKTQEIVTQISKQTAQWNQSTRRLLYYAAFFKPFYKMNSSGSGKRRRSIMFQLLNHGLKRPTCDVQSIESIIKGADTIQNFLEEQQPAIQSILVQEIASVSEQDPGWKLMSDVRWICYKVLKQVGPLWKESLILALSQEFPSDAVERYTQLVTMIEDRLSLVSINQKPMLNGSQIQKALPGVPKGIRFKKIMEAQEEWQVRHPGASPKALIDYLVHTFPEYTNDEPEYRMEDVPSSKST